MGPWKTHLGTIFFDPCTIGFTRSCRFGPLLRLALAGGALKAVEVIGDRHSQSQQLFQCLLRLVESDGDPAGLQADPAGEIVKFLIDDLDRCGGQTATAQKLQRSSTCGPFRKC